jgi:DNA-directed RNA polymerase subunit M/transcription elongation factor TFIIS
MNEDSYWDQDPPAEAYERPSKVTCEVCSAVRYYYVMMQYHPGSLGKPGYYKCTVDCKDRYGCGCQVG